MVAGWQPPWPIDWSIRSEVTVGNRDGDPKVVGEQKTEVGWPGGQNDPTVRGNILRTSRPAQLPNSEKTCFCVFLANFLPPLYKGAGQPYRGRLL